MGLFDGIFNTKPQQNAAQAQTYGLISGAGAATGDINTGLARTDADYAAALAPITANLATYQPGQTLYANALGVNGPAGTDAATAAFRASPGYQYSLEQGSTNLERERNKLGTLASGGTEADLTRLGIGTADQEFQKWLQSPRCWRECGAVARLAGAKAGVDFAGAGKLAEIDWSKFTGIGQAQANADLAQTNVSGNIINAGMQGLKMAVGALPFL
jgi:hypothetical protein